MTLHLYRDALTVRRREGLGSGSLGWTTPVTAGVDRDIAFRNRNVMVVVAFGPDSIDLSRSGRVLLRSGTTADGDAPLGLDCAAWLLA